MSLPIPSKTAANRVGGMWGNTWARVRSTLWPSSGTYVEELEQESNWGEFTNTYVTPTGKRSYGYPASINRELQPFPLLKSFPFDIDQTGYYSSHSLPIGVSYVQVEGWEPPDPNPDNLAGLLHAKLVIGLGSGNFEYFYGQQGSQSRYKFPNNGEYPVGGPFVDYLLGYDYETTKKSLVGVSVNVTVRYWPIPYANKPNGDPPEPQEFTATCTIGEEMFPDNQEWSIPTNRHGGTMIFIGSANYVTYTSPGLFPPNNWTINWIDFSK